MKYKILSLLLLLLLPVSFSLAQTSKPAFRFTDLKGKIYTNATVRGNPVVIYVGSTL